MRGPTLEEIAACPNLPSLPTVAVQVLELTRDADVKLTAIAASVQNDPALAAKILKTVNSSYYGLSKPCPTISRALAYLGLSTVKSLVLGFALVDMSKGSGEGLDLMDFWRRSLYSAAAAKRIATIHGECDAEEGFIAALMQDMGMLAIQTVAPNDYGRVIAEAGNDHRRLPDIEKARLGFDHAEAGSILGQRWHLPPPLVEAIRHHHHGEEHGHMKLVRPVSLAHEVAAALALPNPGEAIGDMGRRAERWFGLEKDSVRQLLLVVDDDVKELSGLFDVGMGVSPDINRILTEAEEASLQHQFEVHRETEVLKKTNHELVNQAATDVLTGVGNRRRFEEELASRLAQAETFKGSLGLLIADADKFKNINDTYGHPAGDAVLVELARRLVAAVRDVDAVCRYGGEEFGVILAGASLKEAAMIAERARCAVAEKPFDLGEPIGPVTVTISIGATAYDWGNVTQSPMQSTLLKAADEALYAAKGAGRNCVRMFRIKCECGAA